MLQEFRRNDGVADPHIGTQATGNAGEHDALRAEALDQCCGSRRSGHLADARQRQHDRPAMPATSMEIAPRVPNVLRPIELLAQAVLLFGQRTQNGGWHQRAALAISGLSKP